MNIFVLHKCPNLAATMLCDAHCQKMIIENCQMLANCFGPERLGALDCPLTQKGWVRKHSYYNHPSSKWVRKNKSNMNWLLAHSFAIEEERLVRGYNPHFSMVFIKWVSDNLNDSVNQSGNLTDFAVAIPENSRCRQFSKFNGIDTVEKYRYYYANDKPFATWRANKPEWLPEYKLS